MPRKGIQKDYVGQRFGRLTVMECLGQLHSPRRKYYWKSVCDCGKAVVSTIGDLTRTDHPTKSCGCLRDERRCKHGLSRTPEYQRQRTLQFEYGLSPEDYQEMLAGQDNKCAICKLPFTETPAVDHDHTCCIGRSADKTTRKTCGKCVRGLLCMNCNAALGNFGDDIQLLLNAVEYLRRFRDVEI